MEELEEETRVVKEEVIEILPLERQTDMASLCDRSRAMIQMSPWLEIRLFDIIHT